MKNFIAINDVKQEILVPMHYLQEYLTKKGNELSRPNERRFNLWLFLDLKTKVTQKLIEITNLGKIRNMLDAENRKITFYLRLGQHFKDIDIRQYGEDLKNIPDNTNFEFHRYENQVLGELEDDDDPVEPLKFSEKYFKNMYMPFTIRFVNYGLEPTDNPYLFKDSTDVIQIIGKNEIMTNVIAKIVDELLETEYKDFKYEFNIKYFDLNSMTEEEKKEQLYHYKVSDLTMYGYDFFTFRNMLYYLDNEYEGHIIYKYLPLDPEEVLSTLYKEHNYNENPVIAASMEEIYKIDLDNKGPIGGPYTKFYDAGIYIDDTYYVFNFNYSCYDEEMFWDRELLQKRYKKLLKNTKVETHLLPMENWDDYYSAEILDITCFFLELLYQKNIANDSKALTNLYFYKNY